MTLTEAEISARIDEIQTDMDNVSAETRNTLHACRHNHPLGRGHERHTLFVNAAFVLSGRRGVQMKHVEWLNKVANQFHPMNAE